MGRNDMLDIMLQYFEPETLLEELVNAMSTSDAGDYFGFICRMHGVDEPDILDMERD